MNHREFPCRFALSVPAVPPRPAYRTDTHELESRIRIRWHKPMRDGGRVRREVPGLWQCATRESSSFVRRNETSARPLAPTNRTYSVGGRPRRAACETRAQRDLCLRGPVNIDALLATRTITPMSMWAYRLPHSVRTPAN